MLVGDAGFAWLEWMRWGQDLGVGGRSVERNLFRPVALGESIYFERKRTVNLDSSVGV